MCTSKSERLTKLPIVHVINYVAKTSRVAIIVCHNYRWIKTLEVQDYHCNKKVSKNLICKETLFIYTPGSLYSLEFGSITSGRYSGAFICARCCIEGETGIRFWALTSLNMIDSTLNCEPRVKTSKNWIPNNLANSDVLPRTSNLSRSSMVPQHLFVK